jgi:hypothetical protein
MATYPKLANWLNLTGFEGTHTNDWKPNVRNPTVAIMKNMMMHNATFSL